MKKTLTMTSIILLVFIILFAGSAFVLSHFVDPNKFKGKISQFVYAKSGQVLVINGNMHWSLFPWIGLKATNLTYYNAPSFTPKTFISAKEMDIKVKLIPLITGKIEIGNITLNDAVLNLIKNKSGQFNWQTITKDKNNPSEENQSNKTNNPLANLSIKSLRIKNGKLNWYDQQKNQQTSINSLNIDSKHIQFGQPFPLSLQFDLLNSKKEKDLSVDLNSDIILSSDYHQYNLQNIKFKGAYFNKDNKLNLDADGDLEINLQKQNLVSKINFEIDSIKGQLNLSGTQISNKPHFNGTLSTDEFNLRKLMQDFGKSVDTKNPDAFKTVSLLSKINFANSTLQLNQLHAKLDKTDIVGSFSATTTTQNINFNLNANQIDIDDYLSGKDNSNDQTTNDLATTEKTKPSAWSVNGILKVANATTDKIKISNILANLTMHNSVIRVSPLHANLYQGQLDGSVIIDKHLSNKTTIFIKQSLKSINVKELLHEVSDSDKLSGTANLTVDLNATTDINTSFLSALNGKMNLALSNGSLQGVDVIYQLSRAYSFIKHLSSAPITDSKQTQFAALTASGIITNGTINTEDLSLTSEYLKVTGKGSTNLVNKDIHYRLNALAQPRLADKYKEVGKEVTVYQVPIKISGKLNKPSVNIDFVELAKNFYAKQIEKPISQQLEKNINHLKDNLKEQVQDKIKSFSPGSLLNKLTKSSDSNANNEAEKSAAETATTANDSTENK